MIIAPTYWSSTTSSTMENSSHFFFLKREEHIYLKKTQFQYCPREAKRSRGFLWCSRGLVVHKTTRTTRWHLGFDRKLDQETTRTPQEFWSSRGLLIKSPSQAQAFFWFSWSRGPRDHKNTTRILVFSWSLG